MDPPWAAVIEALVPLLVSRPPDEIRHLLRRDAGPVLRSVPAVAALAGDAGGTRSSALSDPERRATYDRYGHEGLRSGGWTSSAANFGSLSDLFDAFFGGGGSMFGGGGRSGTAGRAWCGSR